MKTITDEQIIAVAKKYRKELFGLLEKTLCVKHFNAICNCNLPKDTPFVEDGFCVMCQEKKSCVNFNGK